MKRIVMALAAGAVLAAGVATAEPIQLAQTMLDSGIRDEPYVSGAEPAYPSSVRGEYSPACGTVTIHEKKGGRTVTRQVARC
jgi:hypothetical protein